MPEKIESCPSITIAGLRGGSGKTFVSLGLTSFFVGSGKKICPFKKGPDYIDAGWLALAAGRHCYNLDTFICQPEIVKNSYFYHSKNSDLALIEGNRGLYDAIDVEGKTSTAEVAKLLNSPVIVCIDCTKCTMTMAAIVMGLCHFDPDLNLAGVVFNQVAGDRHAGKLRRAVEYHTDVKVVGAIPRVKTFQFPERHMGLVPIWENQDAVDIVNQAGEIIKDNLDTDLVYEIACSRKSEVSFESPYDNVLSLDEKHSCNVRIGVVKDEAFQFYYNENLNILEEYGAELVYISAVKDKELPLDLDALYIGGGFPESFASELAQNVGMRNSIKNAAETGLPVYAECGGLIYLGKSINLAGENYDMCGFFPVEFGISKRPQGHGYVDAVVSSNNPFMEKGTHLKGHEFRYSTIVAISEDPEIDYAYDLDRGVGIRDHKDCITKKNTAASYLHLHGFGSLSWAKGLVNAAKVYSKKKLENI